ncbi:MAG TPA: hypothetical protein VGM03_21410 [Phycisphaerae bacterium]|jgi:hypothetical protein
MPRQVQPLRPRHSRPDLVDELAREMHTTGTSASPDIPTIYEEPQPYGNNLHVKVIWSRWAGIPVEQRGAIILDAYEKAGLKNELRRITVALGLTPEEDQGLQ